MRLTLHTDYALRTLIYLAIKNERLASIKEIARIYSISENHLVKVIHRLGKAKFIQTHRGHKGGIKLNYPAEQINIGDVIRFTEEDLAIVACMQSDEASPACLLEGACVLKRSMQEAQSAFLNVFDKLYLSDIATPLESARINAAEKALALEVE
ncbi:Rrf2 family transcriptional regulator [Aristophania vespae]|uniref:Rrf2 family transcriptional regulator n=1 Tax=Aristophania vespae TaxID=2697033 RepID=A0A6P1NDA8_9PROT|nr:Rrf2 family transcriptional regulator [Aristophania vespae]QHI95449.1 Rrf2 family transcriptional regulator [Aristophania vespae]UMM64746.1 HTH-type transcriptional repressor NsrR [Aristophania vespae]